MYDFWDWWQHLPESINPFLIEIGSFRLPYYGLMYIIAFATTYCLALYRVKHEKRFDIMKNHINELMTAMILGLVIGARLGYVLFYNLFYYLRNPLEIFLPFSFSNGIAFTGISGMSYHGGLIGVIFAAWYYIKKSELNFWQMTDLFAPVIPLGYTFGRLGNFINGELYGRVTSKPFGMYFPLAPGSNLRHPSPLYEAFFEGIFLFAVLWSVRNLKWAKGAMLAFYLIGYGVVRFFIEYFRQPDAHLGFVFLSFSLGQIFSGFMILVGFSVYLYISLTREG